MNNILQPGMHPDADQLSTFVEGVSAAHEREAMLAHLAECSECRSVVFLMQGQEGTHAPTAELSRKWTWRWPLQVGLAGAALACGIATAVYVRTHHTKGEIAGNTARVQTPVAGENETSARAQGKHAPPAEARGADQAHGAHTRAGTEKPDGLTTFSERTTAQSSALARNPVDTVAAVAGPESGANAAASLAPRALPDAGEIQQLPSEARNAVPAPNFATANGLPALRLQHNVGPDDGTSQVSGLVTDQTGAVVAGANVTLRDETGRTRQVISNADGSFSLAEVPPGHYELRVAAKGFQSYQQAMDLRARDMAMLDPKLTVGSSSQTVTVEADALALQTDSNAVSTLIAGEQTSEIATQNRNFAAMAPLGLGAGMAALPSHMPPAAIVELGKRVLSLDNAGTLFVSQNLGKSWKKVKPRWSGGVARIESANDATSSNKAVAQNAPMMFRVTTGDGAVWLSEDGAHWRAQ